MKILVIGDTHFNDKAIDGYIEAQFRSIKKIIFKANPYKIIFLGDFFDKRNPSVSTIVKCNEFLLNNCNGAEIVIIRGNHDSDSKSNDNLSILEVFNNEVNRLRSICIPTSLYAHNNINLAFLPHYEGSDNILKELNKLYTLLGHTPGWGDKTILFGHFGYKGCMNTMDIADFDIDPSVFKTRTVLGHIHKYKKENDRLTVLGTPYTTYFGEAYKKSYYGVIDTKNSLDMEIHEVPYGLYHVIATIEELDEIKYILSAKDCYPLLRVLVDPKDKNIDLTSVKKNILSQYPNIPYIDIKIVKGSKTLESSSKEILKNLTEKYDNGELIKNYVSTLKSPFSKEELDSSLGYLKTYENK